MANSGKVEFAERMRVDGNRWFGEAAFARGERRYSAAINAIAFDQDYTPEEKATVRQVGLLCFLNRAQCCLKLQRWPQARKDAEMALKIDGSNVKAFYRHGVACSHLSLWEEVGSPGFDRIRPDSTGFDGILPGSTRSDQIRADTEAAARTKDSRAPAPVPAQLPERRLLES